MTVRAMNLLGSKLAGWNVIQEHDDEHIVLLRFIDDRGNDHYVQVAVDKDELTFHVKDAY